MSTVFVGETRFPRDFARYVRQFGLLELDCEPGSVPGKARLQACAERAPEDFVFSLVVPSRLASLEPGEDAERAWKAARSVAGLLKARWWVVRTPASVRPTRKAREDLAALFSRLQAEGMRVAWEPHGLWEQASAGETAQVLGAHLVQDIAQQEPLPGEVLYARLLAFGRGARVGLSAADRVVQRLLGFAEALVVVEGRGALGIQRALGLDAAADSEEPLEIEEA